MVRRSYLGLGTTEGGDQLMDPTTMTEAGTTSQMESEDQMPQLAKAITATGRLVTAYRTRTGGKRAHSGARRVREALTEQRKTLDEQEPAYHSKKITELTHRKHTEHWKRFAARNEQAEAGLKAVFMSINAKQRAVALENLRGATGVQKSLHELFNVHEWIAINSNDGCDRSREGVDRCTDCRGRE